MNKIVKEILTKRGLKTEKEITAFLNPDYASTMYDPFLLPDMKAAVERLKKAREASEKVVIYGDYDVDGMTATAILVDALSKFGLDVMTYTPNRFTEGYGLNEEAIESLAKTEATLVITVDCGSLSHREIKLANKLKLDVIVTDHHAVEKTLPPALAVINPHRQDSQYPFVDLAGCGVAFKLVQALQQDTDFLAPGQEKWLLDLLAIGTICDIVPLVDENRNNVYWGIEVLRKTRRLGLKALLAVAKIRPSELDARKIGFGLGPRLNAAGRLETAEMALELLLTDQPERALALAQHLDKVNFERRKEQDRIFEEATQKVNEKDDLIIVSGERWHEGVIGIVASKLVEKYQKPAFVLAVGEAQAKGSGRSFGEFNLAEAIAATKEHLVAGGGHAAAGGVSLSIDKLADWREAMVNYHRQLELKNQKKHLMASEDVTQRRLTEVDVALVQELSKLEPFGLGNEKPVFKMVDMRAVFVDRIGQKKNHLKLTISDGDANLKFLAFDAPDTWFVESSERVNLFVNLEINEWQGHQTVEGRILRLELVD
jgi:single-stranded-DNA-specific exonuclease